MSLKIPPIERSTFSYYKGILPIVNFLFLVSKKIFFLASKKIILFSELKKKLRYSFDAEKVDLSIGGIFRLIGDV